MMLFVLTLTACTNTNKKTTVPTVKKTDTISVTYTGSLEDGSVFDSSSQHPGEALSFTVWEWNIIPWFENWVIWMKLGETKTIKIDAKDAYGESNELLLTQADFDAIAKWGLDKEDMVIWINKIWEVWEIEILRIEDDKYYAKHPSALAWKNLIFEVKIDKITPYIEEQIAKEETPAVAKEIVSAWDKIAVTYTGSLKDGTIFDASSKHGGTPLEFTAWAGQMIAWFDAGVLGMKLWETKTIEIPAKDAYGEEWEHELAWKDLIFEVKIESIK